MTPVGTPTRLAGIEIENYRAFSGRFMLNLPEGCNLLVYGENGAGKSSLFYSLRDFLENPDSRFYDHVSHQARALKYDDYRYRFNNDPAHVRLTFLEAGAGAGPPTSSRVYEWSATLNDSKKPEMRAVDRGKGCLDYRSLLKMHFLPTGQHEVDLFPLFIEVLFAHFPNPISTRGRTFAQEWKEILSAFTPYRRKPKDLDEVLDSFNAGFDRVVKDAFRSATGLLDTFDGELASEVEITPARYIWPPKHLSAPRVIARPSFRRLVQPDYHGFLNEARLSALAIAVYFAALKQSPARTLRLLVLDDILIGLDMANRMAVLRIIERLFRDWQVIILTYHKAWFEVLKARTNDLTWTHPWHAVTLRLGRSIGAECPIVVTDSNNLLSQAREHLGRGDAKAAAVYARSAWESILSSYCSEWRLPVMYAELRRNLNTDAFLTSITQHLETLRSPKDRVWAFGVLAEIRHARRFILNPNAHFSPELEDEINAEIADGITAVEDFETLLRSMNKGDFSKGTFADASPAVGLLIEAAAEHLGSGRYSAAQEFLAWAFARHMDQLFRINDEMVPYGRTPTSELLLNLAGRRFYKGSLSKLRRARHYLLGNVPKKMFDPAAFKSALQLLLHLRLLFLLALPRKRRESHQGVSGNLS